MEKMSIWLVPWISPPCWLREPKSWLRNFSQTPCLCRHPLSGGTMLAVWNTLSHRRRWTTTQTLWRDTITCRTLTSTTQTGNGYSSLVSGCTTRFGDLISTSAMISECTVQDWRWSLPVRRLKRSELESNSLAQSSTLKHGKDYTTRQGSMCQTTCIEDYRSGAPCGDRRPVLLDKR